MKVEPPDLNTSPYPTSNTAALRIKFLTHAFWGTHSDGSKYLWGGKSGCSPRILHLQFSLLTTETTILRDSVMCASESTVS